MEKNKKEAKIRYLTSTNSKINHSKKEHDIQQWILKDLEEINRKLEEHFKEK